MLPKIFVIGFNKCGTTSLHKMFKRAGLTSSHYRHHGADGLGVIIGAQIFGHEACDLIAEMTVAVENGLTLEQVYNSIHPHPTVTEIILEVCKRAVGLSFDK